VKRVVHISSYVVLGLLLLLLILAGVSQTQFFRDRLRSAVLGRLDSLLTATVYLGEFHGNLVTGFSVDSIAIVVDGEPLLSSRELVVRYSLLGIPRKRLDISGITLVDPTICLSTDRQGRWNFVRMMRPAPGDSSSSPFDWEVALDRLLIRNGTIRLTDSAALAAPGHGAVDTAYVEYHRVRLDHFALDLSAGLSRDEKRFRVRSLAFVSHEPSLPVEHVSFDARLTRDRVSVQDLKIRTPGTDLWLQASLDGADLLQGIELRDLQHKPVALEVHADPIDFDEFQKFLDPLTFLRGPVRFSMAADGEFGDVRVGTLEIERGRTSLRFSGSVKNLHDPSNLTLAVTMHESTLGPEDPLSLMPSFELPDYTGMGMVTLSADFRGTPLDFVTHLRFDADGGACPESEVKLTVGGPKSLVYDARFRVDRLDLGKVFGAPGLNSTVNGTVEIRGEGLSLKTLSGTMLASFDSSTFRGLPVRVAQVGARAAGRQVTGSVDLTLGRASTAFSVSLDGRHAGDPGFAINGSLHDLDLAELLQDPSQESRISARLDARGTGLSLRTVSGTLFLDLSGSRYRGYRWDSGAVQMTLDQHDPARASLDLRSSIADVLFRGAFDVGYMVDLVKYEYANVMHALGERLAPFAPGLAGKVDRRSLLEEERRLSAAGRHKLDSEFRISVKDLDPLAVAVGKRLFDGQADVVGSMHGDHRLLDMRGTVNLKEFFVGTSVAGALIQDAAIAFAVDSLQASTALEQIDAELTARVSRLNVNQSEFDSIDVRGFQRDGHASYALTGVFDGTSRVSCDGSARVVSDSLSLLFQRLETSFLDMRWSARPGTRMLITADTIRVSGLILERDSATVTLNGTLGTSGRIDASLSGTRLDLADLRYLISESEHGAGIPSFSGRAGFDATISGTLAAPEYLIHLVADDIRYRSILFGSLDGTLRYGAYELQADVSAWANPDSVAGTPDMRINGSLPVDLSLASAGERFPDAPVDLTITSRGMQMGVLDPLLPTFNDLSGTIVSDLAIQGTLHRPHYAGSIDIKNCRFLFVPNNIPYELEGKFRPEGDRIKVLSAVMRNVEQDRKPGVDNGLSIGGDFALRGLSLEDFNLDLTGTLLVVKETTRKSSLEVYGNLAVEIGRSGLHFSGSMEHSLLKGALLINNSSLVFPPTSAVAAMESQLSVPMVQVNDTTHEEQDGVQTAAERYFGQRGPAAQRGSAGAESTSPSFIDGLRYDLAIEASGGTAEIRMIFNPITGEELVAAINGRFLITDDGRRWVGDLLVERGYYFFFKRFNADGRIRYTGDFLDPVLDIAATYEGSRTVRDTTETVQVLFKITGSRSNPKVEHHMTIDEVDYVQYRGVKSNDIQSDAIAFVITGSFPLTAAQKNDVAADLSSTARLSLLTGAASLLTGTLSEFLRDQTGFIRSVEFSYGSGRGLRESADVRLSGMAWKGYWRYGGRILDDPLLNANLSLVYSVGTVFENPSLNNLMVEFERRVETGSAGQTANDIKRVNSAKLFYRFSF
jgi:hypothetical protein